MKLLNPWSHNSGQRIAKAMPALAIALLLAACSAPAPLKVQTFDQVPASFTAELALSKTPANLQPTDSKPWWEGFQDPLLNDLINRALRQSPAIEAATQRLNASNALLVQAGAGDALLSSLGLEASRRERTGSRNSNDGNSAFLSLNLALPIDINGKVSAQVESAAQQVQLAQAQLRSSLLAVSTEVAQTYLAFRGDQRQLALLQESVSLQDKTLKIVQVRYETGLSPELDLRRAEASVENLRANVAPLEQKLLQGKTRLGTLTGESLSNMQALLAQDRPLPAYQSEWPATLPANVVQKRPDVLAALANLMSRLADTEVARADYYPSLRLAAGLQAGEIASASSVVIRSLSATLAQTLTDGSNRDANFNNRKALALEALANYEQAVRVAFEQVENRINAINNSAARLQSLENATKASRRSFDQANTLYQLGLVSFLDVVDAQRVLANAQQALASEQTSQATLVAGLFQTLGVGPALTPSREPER